MISLAYLDPLPDPDRNIVIQVEQRVNQKCGCNGCCDDCDDGKKCVIPFGPPPLIGEILGKCSSSKLNEECQKQKDCSKSGSGEDCYCCPEPIPTTPVPATTAVPITTAPPQTSAPPHPTTTVAPTTTTAPACTCNIAGKSYGCSTSFSKNCLRFNCDADGQWTTLGQYNSDCGKCQFNNDPHFTIFGGITFDWHGHSSYVISQETCVDCPDTFVNSYFYDCTSGWPWATCVHTVYFQPEPGTFVEIVKADPIEDSQIIIDGHSQKLSADELTVLEGPDGVQHPAFGLLKDGCIHVFGVKDEGYVVKICYWSAQVLAYPTLKTKTCGLCGQWAADSNDDLKLRDGTIIPPPTDVDVDPIYGEDWETKNCNGKETLSSKRHKRSVENTACNATDEEKEKYKENCKDLGDDFPELVAECALDQCVAARSGDETLMAQWVSNSKLNVQEAKQQQENTIVYPPEVDEHKVCKVLIGEKYHFFNCKFTFSEANSTCVDSGCSLATPYTKEEFSAFNEVMPKAAEFWVGIEAGEIDSTNWYWMTSPPNKTEAYQWNKQTFPTVTAKKSCASLYRGAGLLNQSCNSKFFFACECEAVIEPRMRSHTPTKTDVNFPSLLGAGRNI